jgi:hypothetical protein
MEDDPIVRARRKHGTAGRGQTRDSHDGARCGRVGHATATTKRGADGEEPDSVAGGLAGARQC